jgi:hypothetical protein
LTQRKSGAALPTADWSSVSNAAPLRYLDVGTIHVPDGLFLVLSEPNEPNPLEVKT